MYICDVWRSSWCVPIATIFPSSRTIIWSAFITVLKRWAIITWVTLWWRRAMASLMANSLSESRCDVLSSKLKNWNDCWVFSNAHSEWKEKQQDKQGLSSYMSNEGCINNALAIAILCRCPPLSFTPRSPITLSYPFGVELTMKSWAPLNFAASMISFKVAYKWIQSIVWQKKEEISQNEKLETNPKMFITLIFVWLFDKVHLVGHMRCSHESNDQTMMCLEEQEQHVFWVIVLSHFANQFHPIRFVQRRDHKTSLTMTQ